MTYPKLDEFFQISTADFTTEAAALAAIEYRLLYVVAVGRNRAGPGLQARCGLIAGEIGRSLGQLVPDGTPILIPYTRNRRGQVGYRNFVHQSH